MVGAVILRDGEILAEGYHRAPGLAHAEPDALSRLEADAAGATMVVNLEPCCHHGRTAPCTDAILASGVERVVVGMVDPDRRVAGRGISILREAGLTVEVGILEEECRRLNAAYLCAVERGRPLVVLKAAATLDGRIADAQGRSQWITGAAARAAGHRLRDRLDAVLVGSGTLLADDPSLNTRAEGGRDALPVVLDTELRCPPDARVLTAGRRPLIFCATDAQERDLGADIVRVPRGAGGLELRAVLEALVARGVHSVLVEGGGRVHRSFLDGGCADRVHLHLAPKVLAGGAGWVGGDPLSLAGAHRFTVTSVSHLGDDVLIEMGRLVEVDRPVESEQLSEQGRA